MKPTRIGDRLTPYKATSLTRRQQAEHQAYRRRAAAARLRSQFPMHEGVRDA